MKLNVIVIQVEQEAFTRELVAVVHLWRSNYNLIDVYNTGIWPELYLLLNRPKIHGEQYPLFVAGVIDEDDTLKYSNWLKF